MATHILMPADIEPSVVCTLNGKTTPDWSLLEVSADRKVEGGKETYNPRVEWLDSLQPSDRLFAPLGGVGHAFLAGAAARGINNIHRITFKDLKEHPHLGDVKIPPSVMKAGDQRHQERCRNVAAMVELVRQDRSDLFREYREADVRITLLRVYINTLIAVQDEARKRLQQRTTRLERDQQYFLSVNAKGNDAFDLKATLIEANQPIDAMIEYEGKIELEIKRQLRQLKIWTDVLEPVRGIGPRLGARIIGAVVDIRRFPRWQMLSKYGGWSINDRDGRKVSPRYTRDESAQFDELLREGLWLFGQQIMRNSSQFAWYANRYKLAHQHELDSVEWADKAGKEFKLSKAWLHSRALRSAVQRFVKYLYHGWAELEEMPTGFNFPASNWLAPEKYNKHQPV